MTRRAGWWAQVNGTWYRNTQRLSQVVAKSTGKGSATPCQAQAHPPSGSDIEGEASASANNANTVQDMCVNRDKDTGIRWTWFDETDKYNEGWWARLNGAWVRYEPQGEPRRAPTLISVHTVLSSMVDHIHCHHLGMVPVIDRTWNTHPHIARSGLVRVNSRTQEQGENSPASPTREETSIHCCRCSKRPSTRTGPTKK